MIQDALILNTSNKSISTIIHAAQGENGARRYDITLVNDVGEIIDISGCIVNMYVQKNDGTISMLPATIQNNTALVTLTLQSCACVGDNSCWIQVINSATKKELRVDNLILRVKKCNFDGAIISTNEFTSLTQKISEANTATQNANQAAQTAVSTAATTAINTVNDLKGKPNGVAALDANGKLAQMPTVDDLDIKNIFLSMYPVGSIYITTSATNPGTLFGGVWRAFAPGRVLVGVNPSDSDFSTSGKMGGSKTHTLTVNEMPKHVHTQTLHWSAQAGNSSVVSPALETNDPREYSTYPTTGETGGGQPHNNLQPYITCYMWRRSA